MPTLLYADPANADDLAAAERSHHRRRSGRQARHLDLVCGRLERGARGRPPAAVEGAHGDLCARDRPAAIPIFSRIISRSITTQRFDPATHAEQRAAHLKDYGDLLADAAAGRLPAVVFYKPQGNLNQHAGYASVAEGDAHIADLVAKLRASPQWPHMVIVITYDEFGGAWDHVAPPQGDLLGPRRAHSGVDHFALREARHGRSHASTTPPRFCA